jgi:hypothetical protein
MVAAGDGGLHHFNMDSMRHDTTPSVRVPAPITSLSRTSDNAWLVGCSKASIYRWVSLLSQLGPTGIRLG